MEKRKEKAKESIQAVLPILFIVLLLSFTVAPVSASILLEFMIGAVFVIIGMLFFSMGAEMSMSPMGERVGGSMLKTKKLWVILLLGFFLGGHHYHFRTGSAGACRSGAVGTEYGTDSFGGSRGWSFSCSSIASYFIWNSPGTVVICVLWGGICDRTVCPG